MKKRIIIPLTILVIILTLAIFSITIKSVNWDVKKISEVTSTTELARLISLHPDEFWNATVDEIFSKNTRKRHNGTYGLDGNEQESPAEYVDIYYHTAACIFHDQTDKNGDNYAHKITNIIEIESPGIMTVYKYTGDRRNSKYEAETLDLSTKESAKAVFDKMKAQGIIDKSETFNYDNMKKDITAFAYLINQTTKNAENAKNANKIADEDYAYTNTKNAIHWFWKQPGGTIAIRKYAKATGKLDAYYYNAQKQNDEVTAEAESKRKEALKAAASAIQPAMIEKLNASSQTLTVSYVNDKAYIGPLKVKYSGGTPTVKINVGESKENWITASGWVTYDSAKETFNSVQTGVITSGQEFYAVTDKTKVEALSKINVKVELQYIKYSAKLALTTAKTNDSQNLMFYMGKKEQKVIPVDWQGEISKKIEIQKQDENGNILKQAGIKFEVYDEAGKLIGTLTTKNDGKTNSIGLVPNTVYIIKETVNNEYGYKNASIKDATITKGGTITAKTAEQIKVKITDNAVITIKNAPEFGDLTIKKVDENGKGMPGVEFVIWQSYKGYLSIDGQATHTTPLKGTNMKAMHESDKIIYPIGATMEQELAQATRYITNDAGEIVLNNLEIYRAKGQKYEYIIREMSNPNYGYKGMVMTNEDLVLTEAEGSDIQGTIVKDMYSNDTIKDGGKDVLRKKVQFTIGRDTTITVSNTPKLGNLVVHKKDKNKNLENAEFTLYKAVSRNAGYIRLIKDSQFIPTVNTEIDITDYEVEYVGVDKVNEATIFKTNKDGKIIINNLEIYLGIDENYNPVKYDYWLTEQSNNEYGYKNMTMTVEGVTSEGGTIIETDPGAREVQFALDEIKTTVTINIENLQEIASLEIQKVNTNNEPIGNVEFVLERGNGQFIVLINKDEKEVDQVIGTATINIDSNFELEEYEIDYTDNKNYATRFVTDHKGKVTINNLEIYASKAEKYTYTAHEVANDNYGYGSVENSNLSKMINELKFDETNILKIENLRHLGKFAITKHDKNSEKIVLPNVGFVIEQTSEKNEDKIGRYAYLALYDESGNLQSRIIGDAIINENNKAETIDGIKEYKVKYYYSELPYSELTDEQKAQITIFVTDNNGNISVDNLEVYSPLLKDVSIEQDKDARKYTYKLIETSNENYGYEIEKFETLKFKVDSNTENTQYVKNEQTKIKISGYVWEERTLTKSNEYDLLYVENTADNKLTDLYIWNEEEGKLEQNLNARIPVRILLKDKTNNRTREPDEFIYKANGTDQKVEDAGKYTFEVEIAKLADYEIIFEYDGFYYTTIIPNLNEGNGSKVKEVETERKSLNEKFGEVKYDREIVGTDGKTETLEYKKEGNQSFVTKFNFNVNVHATTSETNINLKDKYDGMINDILNALNEAKENDQEIKVELPEVIDNINMGIMLREQPSIFIGSDIDSVLVDVNETEFIYKLGSRQYEMQFPEDPEKSDKVGVQFEELTKKISEENKVDRYMTKVYASDFNGIENNTAEMNVSVIYKIQISKLSDKFTSVVHKIENFYDSEYTIQEIGLSIDNKTKQIGNKIYDRAEAATEISKISCDNIGYSDDVKDEVKREYCSSIIPLGENGLVLSDTKNNWIYIKFEISQEAIKDLQSGKSTYHNATEIVSYSTYYNENTGKGEVVNQESKVNVVTEQGKPGEVYAGITKGAEAGNIKLNMIKDSRDNDGKLTTPVLDKEYFEIDETSAPALILVKEGTRTISGSVWEDLQTKESEDNNERLGNGIYDESENPIQNVTVSLHKINESNGAIGEIAKLSDNTPAVVETNAEGKYTLGDSTREAGVLPGKYVIVYTYGKDKTGGPSVIVTKDGRTEIDAIDYKSTIIKSETMYNAYTQGNNYNWFITEENNARYSNARDNVTLREEYKKMVDLGINEVNDEIYQHIRESVLNYGTLEDYKLNKMEAYTPEIQVGINFTADNQIQATNRDENGNITYAELDEELSNVDFGIIERPRVIMDIDVRISQLEVIAQNGASIIPMGDPSDLSTKMQSVMKLDGKVVSVVEKELLQGATMNLEYTVNVENNSETDYFELDYYYYGNVTEGMKAAARPKQVISYLPESLKLDESKNKGEIWKKTDLQTLKDNEMISNEVAEALGNDIKCNIYTTNAYQNLEQSDNKDEKMYVSKVLAMSDETELKNSVEIIELTGIRPIKGAVPGNYVYGATPSEIDEDIEIASVVTPTGLTVNYTLYIIAAVATFAIIGMGILIIKKKVIK